MAFDSKGLDDYIDVAQRIAEFRAKHPEGSLQPVDPAQPFEIRDLTGTDKNGKEITGTFIIYTAAAYRTPDDQRPGIGCAYEVFPGRTPYTAGSELQNAETAAWGRAIVAALAADTRAGVASQQEIRNRRAERDDTPAQPRQARNGRQQGQVTRPAAVQDAEPAAEPEIDEEGQELATLASECRTLNDLKSVYGRAQHDSKLRSFIADPATGTKGRLGNYLNYRRKVLEDTDAALRELNDAAGRHATSITELERRMGTDLESATPGQIREFIASLDGAAA